VREDVAFVYLEHVDGPGGSRLAGSQEPVIALVSGGIDSPVAAYEMMKRGSPVIPAYVDLGDYGGIDHEARALETVRILSEYAPNFDMQVYEIPAARPSTFSSAGWSRADALPAALFLSRRRDAGRARQRGRHRHRRGRRPEVQPDRSKPRRHQSRDQIADPPSLLTRDKQYIVAQAREIGTYTDSTMDAGCNRVTPDQVETNARLEPLLAAEPNDLLERAEEAAKNAILVEP